MGMGIGAMMATHALADQAYWTGLAGPTWNAGLTNWNTSATSGTPVSALPGVGTDVFFSTRIPRSQNPFVTLGTNFSVNSLTFSLYSGLYVISGGSTLTIAASGGTGITVEDGSSSHEIGANILLSNPQVWTNNGSTGVTTLSVGGAINATAAGGQLTIAGSGGTFLSGAIGSNITEGIVKTGTGVMRMNNQFNAFSGGLTINGGVVSVTGDSQLGAASNGVTLNAGGTLDTHNGWTLGAGRIITVNGTALNPSGLQVGSTLRLGSNQLQGGGTLQIAGDYPSTPTAPSILYVDGANSGFTGHIVVGVRGKMIGDYFNQESASLSLRDAGRLAGASSITAIHGSGVSITQSSTAVTGRLGSGPLTFHTARFQYNSSANGGAAINDTFGNVRVTGQWLITGSTVAGPLAGTTLNFGNLTRDDRAMLIFRAPQAGIQGTIGAPASTSVRMLFANLTPDTTTSGLTRSVVPWASNAPSTSDSFNNTADNLMTYDANGFRPLNIATETIPAFALGANVRLTASSSGIPVGGISVNSLTATSSTQMIVGDATASAPGSIITITSGALVGSSQFTLSSATVNFPNGGYIQVGNHVALTFNSRFTGSGGIAVGALTSSSELQFTNTPNGGNTFTGGLYINGDATVTFRLNNQLGNDIPGRASGNIVLGGGNLVYYPTPAATAVLSDIGVDRAIAVNESGGSIGNRTSGAILQIPGTISGPGQVVFGGGFSSSTGVVELTNASANTYAGGSIIRTGILRISNANQLGTGEVFLSAGTLQASADVTLASAPRVVGSSTIDTQANNITLSAGIDGAGGVGGSNATNVSLTKQGVGTLTIGGDSDFAGVLTASAGRVVVSGSISGANNINVDATASVELGGSHRFSLEADLMLNGGAFLTAGFSEDLGTLTLSGTVASTIDLGSGSSRFTLAASHLVSWSGGATLNIRNWSGNSLGGGIDQIFFGTSSTALTGSQIAKITFIDPLGFAPGSYSAQLLGTGELTVIPEPGSLALLLCGGMVLGSCRKRRR